MERWQIGAIVALVVVLALPLLGLLKRRHSDVTISTPAGSITIKADAIERMRKAESQPPVVTLEEYNKVRTGMTYAEVEAIIGEPGRMTSENQWPSFSGGPGKLMQDYQWSNPQFMSYMSADFEDGVLARKSMSNLK